MFPIFPQNQSSMPGCVAAFLWLALSAVCAFFAFEAWGSWNVDIILSTIPHMPDSTSDVVLLVLFSAGGIICAVLAVVCWILG